MKDRGQYKLFKRNLMGVTKVGQPVDNIWGGFPLQLSVVCFICRNLLRNVGNMSDIMVVVELTL